jgi:hypothetical protein
MVSADVSNREGVAGLIGERLAAGMFIFYHRQKI